jgi:hypothetical protein
MLNYTYKKLLTDLKGIAYHHKQIRSFGIGDLNQVTMDLSTLKEPEFVRMYCVPGLTQLNENHIHYNFSIIIMDLVNNDISNLKDVMSDTLEIAKDIYTMFMLSYKAIYGDISRDVNPDENPEIHPFEEEYEQKVAGWTLNISVSAPFDYSVCHTPIQFGYRFPQDQTFESWRVVLDDFEKFANLHYQINSFGFGSLEQLTVDVKDKVEPMYPRMWVEPQVAKVHTGHMHITWRVFYLDVVNNDNSNLQDIWNDTLELVKDLFSNMYLSEYESDFDCNVSPILNRYETSLAGWYMDVSMTQKFDFNRCVLPTTDYITITNYTWEQLDELWSQTKQTFKNI